MAKMVNPQQAAQAWVQGMQASQQKVRDGVNAVSESPTAAAARSVDFWQQQVSSSETRQRYLSGLSRVSAEDWKRAMLNKGVNRIGTGAAEAQNKFTAFMTQFLPFVQSVAERTRQMPKGGIENNIARMIFQVRETAKFQRSA